MKKRLIVAACFSFVVFGSAIAQTQTTEPSVPNELSSPSPQWQWKEVAKNARCHVSPTQTLVQNEYVAPVGGSRSVRRILTTERNGKPFVQMDVEVLDGEPFRGYFYLKTHEGWFSYDMGVRGAFLQYTKDFNDELGITAEEYKDKCMNML